MQDRTSLLQELFLALQEERESVARLKEHLNTAALLSRDPGCGPEVKENIFAHIAQEEGEHLARLDALLARFEAGNVAPTDATALPTGRAAEGAGGVGRAVSRLTVGSLIGK